MKYIGYYAWHTFVNSIKKLFRSTFIVIIAAIIGFGVIFGVAAGVVGSVVEKESENSTEYSSESSETYDDDSEEENSDDEMTDEDIVFVKHCAEAVIAVGFIGFILFGMYSGSKKGSDIFLMADVNFLFTAPLKPQSVLMFRLTFQMAATILGSVYLLFQIPNLVVNLGLNTFAIVAIFMAWIFLLLIQKLVSVLTYTVTATHERLKQYVMPIIIVIALIVAGYVGTTYLQNGRDIAQAGIDTFGNANTRMIPVIGWYKGMIMAAVDGDMMTSLIYTGLLILVLIVMCFGIWHIKADFYEDALSGAATREETQQAALEGRKVATKERSAKIKRNTGMKGEGGSIFFWKEVYNRRRFATLGFLTNTMKTYILTAVVVSVFCIKVVDVSQFAILGGILAAIAFFRNYGNPIATETSMNWLFLVPDSPYRKVFSAMAAGTYACAIDLLPAFVIGAIIMPGNPLDIVLWYLQIVTMDFMLSTVGMVLEVLLPASAFDVVKSMLQMMLKFVMIAVIVIVIAVGTFISGLALGLILSIVVNVILGGLLFLIYPTMLHDGVA